MAKRFKTTAHKTFAGFMALWLSGFLFLIACHAQSSQTFSCPLMKMGAHCDFAEKQKNAEKFTPPTTDNGIDCCAFIPAFFDKTRTNEGQPQTLIAATVAIVEEKKVATRINFAPARSCIPVSIP